MVKGTGTTKTSGGHKRESIAKSNKRQEAVENRDQREL